MSIDGATMKILVNRHRGRLRFTKYIDFMVKISVIAIHIFVSPKHLIILLQSGISANRMLAYIT